MPEDIPSSQPAFHIRIASPCSADWEKMSGNDRVRHCAECNLNVYNLSAMSTREAAEMLAKTQGRLCVRFYRRSDGKILTQDCPLGLRAIVRRVSKIAGVALSAVIGFGVSATAALAQGTPALVQTQQKPAAILVEVVDPQGAVIANARVVLHDEGNSWSVSKTTNQEGQLDFRDLSPGSYALEVTAAGFEAHRETLRVYQEVVSAKVVLRVGVALQGGAIAEPSVTLIQPEVLPAQDLQPVSFIPIPTNRENPLKKFFRQLVHKLGF